jgi:uncharacterized protein DUF4440
MTAKPGKRLRKLSLAMSMVVICATHAIAQANARRADSTAVVGVVNRFHESLARGDSASAVGVLSSDAIILESGELEQRAQYIEHHLPADIAFAKAVQSTRVVKQVTIVGDAAWIVSTSTASGTFEGRAIASSGAELIVLRRENSAWRIVAVHWSSRRGRSGS